MKSKLTNRLLATVVIAVVLSVFFAVSSLAAITGGYGEFEGLEEGKSYEAASVTINKAGTATSVDEAKAFDLDASSNKDLAGLYVVREKGTIDWSEVIYVYGKYQDRTSILESLKVTTYKQLANNNSNFNVSELSISGPTPFAWKTTDVDYTYKAGSYGTYLSGSNTVQNNFLAATTPEAKSEALANLQTKFSSIKITYAFNSEEIVSISDVNSYKFGLKGYYESGSTMTYKNIDVEFDALIADENGTVTRYTYLFDGNTTFSSALAEYVVDFKSNTGWSETLPSTGWLVGFEVRPFCGMDNPDNLTITGSTAKRVGILFYHYYNEYKINVAKLLEGISVEGTVISGLNPSATYEVASYGLDTVGNGKVSTDVKTITGATTADLKDYYGEKAGGVYKIAEIGNLYFDFSAIIYAKGSYENRVTILECMDVTSQKDGTGEFVTGFLSAPKGVNFAIKAGITAVEGAYASRDGTGSLGGTPQIDFNAEGADKETVFTTIQNTLKAYNLKYAFNPDEVLPISDAISYKFGLKAWYNTSGSTMTYKNNTVAFDALVLDANGDVKTYTYLFENDTYSADLKEYVVDFKSATGWTESLPSEGWLVGFVVHPYYGVNDYNNLTITPNASGAYSRKGTYFYHYYNDYKIKEDAAKPNLASFPVIEGGYGEVSGLLSSYEYEYQFSTDDGATWSAWKDVTKGVTAFKVDAGGIYRVRVKESDDYHQSEYETVTVDTYKEALGERFESEIAKMHLPNDFVELKADYEIDLTLKNWVSALALENIKTVTPESVITLAGEDYKFVVTASNISTDGKVHYYNMAVSLDGESRYNTVHDKLVEMAGSEYVTDVYFESSNGLPFEEAELTIAVDRSFDGSDIEVRSYSEKIEKLRKVEETTVNEGFVTITNFAETYVLVVK